MPSCPKCGAFNPDGGKRCGACAASLVSTVRVQKGPATAPASPVPAPATTTGRGWLVPGIIIVAVVVAAVLVARGSAELPPHVMTTGARYAALPDFLFDGQRQQGNAILETWKHASGTPHQVGVLAVHNPKASGPEPTEEAMGQHLQMYLRRTAPELVVGGFPRLAFRSVAGRATMECTIDDPKLAGLEPARVPPDEIKTIHVVLIRQGDDLFLANLGYNTRDATVDQATAALAAVVFR